MEISKAKEMSDHEIIEAMVLNPILFERPVVINGNNAIIARPINNVNEII
ncbi:ArsC/Spx/MgsR family protein [Flavobacterium sp.]